MSHLIETLYNDYDITVDQYGDGPGWHWARKVGWFANTCPPDGFETAEEAAQDAALACGLINEDGEPSDNMTDAEADADTLASAGWGTDEDYGYYHDELERDHDEPYEPESLDD